MIQNQQENTKLSTPPIQIVTPKFPNDPKINNKNANFNKPNMQFTTPKPQKKSKLYRNNSQPN